LSGLDYAQEDKLVVCASADGRIRILDDRDPDGYVMADPTRGIIGKSVLLREIRLRCGDKWGGACFFHLSLEIMVFASLTTAAPTVTSWPTPHAASSENPSF
jgi:hypothetical protein